MSGIEGVWAHHKAEAKIGSKRRRNIIGAINQFMGDKWGIEAY